jgi:hypothetical protein
MAPEEETLMTKARQRERKRRRQAELNEAIWRGNSAPAYAIPISRRDDAVFPQPPKDNQAVEAGQHAIDGHDRVFIGTAAAQPVVAIDREIDLIAAVRKRIHELFRGSRDRLRGPECGAVLQPCFSSSNPTSII